MDQVNYPLKGSFKEHMKAPNDSTYFILCLHQCHDQKHLDSVSKLFVAVMQLAISSVKEWTEPSSGIE